MEDVVKYAEIGHIFLCTCTTWLVFSFYSAHKDSSTIKLEEAWMG